jgi:23S rRNA pseudouridine1911/1915/1917 synthase
MTDRIETFCYKGPASERLDRFLVVCLPEFSRARLQGLISDGFVLIDGSPARKSGQAIETGAKIEVHIPPTQSVGLLAENIPLDVIFENDDLLIVNKPAGMVVHPAFGHDHGTLVNAVLGHDPEIEGIGGEERPGIVHRLDKDTSGLIVVAKNDAAMRWLQEQFRQRTVQKTYLALVDGAPPTPTGRIEAPIGRDPKDRKKMAVTAPAKGREAISEYATLETFRQHSLLEFHPLTGRTHQIRLHCAFLGCPIVGDAQYGHRKISIEIKRHFLHAFQIKLTLPGEQKARIFEAPLPAELAEVLNALRSG